MKKYLFLVFVFFTYNGYATDVDSLRIIEKEAAMRGLIETVLTNPDAKIREESSIKLEKMLEETLKEEGAYEYSFADLKGVSILQPGDKTFKIFTWQLFIDDNTYQYKGFIQTQDGKIHKLQDKSADMRTVEFSILKPENWYGALYYNLKEFKHEGETAYLLFGYDAFEFYNRRKVLDVLYFDSAGKPKFGKSVIEVKDAQGRMREVKRYVLEYSSSVNVTMNFSKEHNMVVYDHLIYGTPLKSAGPSNVPDGSYCGLKLTKEGKWQYVDKVYQDDPANILVDATSYEKILQDEKEQPRKKKKDIFGRTK